MSACGFGKMILLGEHAAVYGHPVLAGAIDRSVCFTAMGNRIVLPEWNLDIDRNADHPVADALRDVARALSCELPGLVGAATVPASAGLGSSAALAVAAARAMAPHCTHSQIETAAHAAEQRFHARPSGVDVALATRGGVGVFVRGHGLTPLVTEPLAVAIALSGIARATHAMVAHVAEQTLANPSDDRLVALGQMARLGAVHFQRGEFALLGALMDDAHDVLGQLGVSLPELDALCATARAAGAWGAKLTGAGGGGAVVAIAPDPHEIVTAWQASGATAFVANVGVRA